MNKLILGKQTFGQSSNGVYQLALQAFADTGLNDALLADIGAGQGNFEQLIAKPNRPVLMVDDFEPTKLPPHCQWARADLNEDWNLKGQKFDFVFALEVIEHLENPRHFFRELVKLIKPGGYGFISTPNNEGLFSKLNFLINSQHRWFQDSCYPAHITPVLLIDFVRLLKENNLDLCKFYYGMGDFIPLIGTPLPINGSLFSRSIGVLFKVR